MANYRPDEDRREFPPELQQYDPADGWVDRQQWWQARIEFAREHGVYGRTASGDGKILPLIQEMTKTQGGNDDR